VQGALADKGISVTASRTVLVTKAPYPSI